MKQAGTRRWLPLILMCWMLSACAALPNVKGLGDQLEPPAAPSVTGVNGALSDSRAKSLLAKRWTKGTLDLQAQAALEEAATGVPLIAGNKCTLLFDGPQTMAEMYKAIAGARNN